MIFYSNYCQVRFRCLIGVYFLLAAGACDNFAHAQKLLIHGGGAMSPECDRAFLAAAGKNARLVVIPTASAKPKSAAKIKETWQRIGFSNVSVLHTTDRKIANTRKFVKPLKLATAVWISGGNQNRLNQAYVDTLVERTLIERCKKGMVIGGSSAGAAIQSKIMIAGGRDEPEVSQGFDLLPDTIIDQHFLARSRINRLMHAVKKHPDKLGIGIDEGVSLLVDGKRATVSGKNSYVVCVQWVDGHFDVRSHPPGARFKLPNSSKSTTTD